MGRARNTSTTCTDKGGKEISCEDARGSFFQGEEKVRVPGKLARGGGKITHFLLCQVVMSSKWPILGDVDYNSRITLCVFLVLTHFRVLEKEPLRIYHAPLGS